NPASAFGAATKERVKKQAKTANATLPFFNNFENIILSFLKNRIVKLISWLKLSLTKSGAIPLEILEVEKIKILNKSTPQN
ncbi:MAG TPA: hypothetical protein PK197_04350, partial [Candidatus Cloacimonas sp.]|nr:hypothetical protein [Candidatus Cloacimonas sp.]